MSFISVPLPALLTLDETAQALKLSREAVLRFERLGKVPRSVQIGRKRRWRQSDIRGLLSGDFQ
jgi:predicted DNA-binding transcriptional regulator AlpA